VKQIILVAGHAGSGKTEFSKQLAVKTSLPLLDKDTMTRPLVERLANHLSGDPYDRQSPAYLNQIRRLEYDSLFAVMWEMLESGSHGVIVTAPFVAELTNPKWVDDFVLNCDAHGCKLLIVWVHCDPAILKKRIVARCAERDRWKLDNWSRWVNSLITPELDKEIPQLIVDNTAESAEPMRGSIDVALDRLEVR
jgi:predicted kinase